MRRLDLTGMRFGKLMVIRRAPNNGEKILWYCQCDCGRRSKVYTGNLRRGRTKGCGCQIVHQTHDMSYTSTYRIWAGMKQRCLNPRSHAWKYYGGRGIVITKRWLKFENFFADMGERPPRLTIERTNNEKGYSKRNCIWATRSQQQHNKRMWKK